MRSARAAYLDVEAPVVGGCVVGDPHGDEEVAAGCSHRLQGGFGGAFRGLVGHASVACQPYEAVGGVRP